MDLERFRSDTHAPRNYDEEPELSEEDYRSMVLANLGVIDPAHTFASLKTPPGFETTLAAFKEMASGKARYALLMVYGGIGNGKSMCCEATVIEMYARGLRVKRDRWSDIVRALKGHFSGRGAVTYEEYFATLRARARLILDDVGSGSTLGSWEWGELEDIIDWRYERRMWTIVTTNLDIKQFPGRILSRFRDKTRARLVLNEAADQRPLLEAPR